MPNYTSSTSFILSGTTVPTVYAVADGVGSYSAGDILGTLEDLSISHSYLRGDVRGSSDTAPSLSGTLFLDETNTDARELDGAFVEVRYIPATNTGYQWYSDTIQYNYSRFVGTLSLTGFNTTKGTCEVVVTSILDNLNTEVTLRPFFSTDLRDFTAGYIRSIFCASKIFPWNLPGDIWCYVPQHMGANNTITIPFKDSVNTFISNDSGTSLQSSASGGYIGKDKDKYINILISPNTFDIADYPGIATVTPLEVALFSSEHKAQQDYSNANLVVGTRTYRNRVYDNGDVFGPYTDHFTSIIFVNFSNIAYQSSSASSSWYYKKAFTYSHRVPSRFNTGVEVDKDKMQEAFPIINVSIGEGNIHVSISCLNKVLEVVPGTESTIKDTTLVGNGFSVFSIGASNLLYAYAYSRNEPFYASEYLYPGMFILETSNPFWIFKDNITRGVSIQGFVVPPTNETPNSNPFSFGQFSGSGWEALNTLLLYVGAQLDTQAMLISFNHVFSETNYNPSAGVSSALDALGYVLSSDINVDSSSSSSSSQTIPYTYSSTEILGVRRYGKHAYTDSVGILDLIWSGESTMTVRVGEKRRETLTLPDGLSLWMLGEIAIMDTPANVLNLVNGGGLGYASFYSVYTVDENAVVPTMWEQSGASVLLSLSPDGKEVYVDLIGPTERLFPGNDALDNGTYEIGPVPSGNKSIFIFGAGMKSETKSATLRTADYGKSGVKYASDAIDMPQLDGRNLRWGVLNTLLASTKSYTASMELQSNIIPQYNLDVNWYNRTDDSFVSDLYLSQPPNRFRIGPDSFVVTNYTMYPGGKVSINEARLQTALTSVDDMYHGKTVSQVDNIKSGLTVKKDDIFPLGKDLI